MTLNFFLDNYSPPILSWRLLGTGTALRRGSGGRSSVPMNQARRFSLRTTNSPRLFLVFLNSPSCRILFNDALIASYRANRRGYGLYHLIAEDKGGHAGEGEEPRPLSRLEFFARGLS